MFCLHCGHELREGAAFCSYCGKSVVQQAEADESTVTQAPEEDVLRAGTNAGEEVLEKPALEPDRKQPSEVSYGQKEKEGSYDSNLDKVERFAPLAAFAPLVIPIGTAILLFVLKMILGHNSLGRAVLDLLVLLLPVVFKAIPLAACGILGYGVIKKKQQENIWAWVPVLITFLAFIACLLSNGKGKAIAWILGGVCVVFGFEFLARICINKQPAETKPDFPAMFRVYGDFVREYKAKNPTTKDLERAGIEDPEGSKFDGTGLQLFGYLLLAVLVSGCTCGLAAPWMICMVYNWRISHTVINGKRLRFTGTGLSLLGFWILREILTFITCGLYGYFLYVAMRKWLLSHTALEGESVSSNSEGKLFDGKGFRASYFDGTGLQYMGYQLLSFFMLLFSLGLAYPWVMAMMTKWDTKHQVIGGRRLVFSGSGLGFLGEYLIIAILTFLTCGLYSFWGIVRMNKYIIRHTDFEA
ncbi:MAG: zinc-ribbon domain-containing protein [Lachnospiraceae bacterium]|nr:zinc-ribbon domain-containing protein [Lachnospiraceae bacterium]